MTHVIIYPSIRTSIRTSIPFLQAVHDTCEGTLLTIAIDGELVFYPVECQEPTLLDSFAHASKAAHSAGYASSELVCSPSSSAVASSSSSSSSSSSCSLAEPNHPLMAALHDRSTTSNVATFEHLFFQYTDDLSACSPDQQAAFLDAFVGRVFPATAAATSTVSTSSTFWPRRALAYLMENYLLCNLHVSQPGLLRVLLQRRDWALMEHALAHVQDIPERDLVYAMRFVLSHVAGSELERELDERVQATGQEVRFPVDRGADLADQLRLVNGWTTSTTAAATTTPTTTTTTAGLDGIPVETAVDHYLRAMVTYETSEVMMTRALKSLTTAELGAVMGFCLRWMQRFHLYGSTFVRQQLCRKPQPTATTTTATTTLTTTTTTMQPLQLSHLLTLVGQLLDAHLTTIILTASLHPTFLALVQYVRMESVLCTETESLRGILEDTYRLEDYELLAAGAVVAAPASAAPAPTPSTTATATATTQKKKRFKDRTLFIRKQATVADRLANRSLGSYGIEEVQWW